MSIVSDPNCFYLCDQPNEYATTGKLVQKAYSEEVLNHFLGSMF